MLTAVQQPSKTDISFILATASDAVPLFGREALRPRRLDRHCRFGSSLAAETLGPGGPKLGSAGDSRPHGPRCGRGRGSESRLLFICEGLGRTERVHRGQLRAHRLGGHGGRGVTLERQGAARAKVVQRSGRKRARGGLRSARLLHGVARARRLWAGRLHSTVTAKVIARGRRHRPGRRCAAGQAR